jgi:hypothetical protein
MKKVKKRRLATESDRGVIQMVAPVKPPGAIQMVADSMDFYRPCEVRSNPGCSLWIASPSFGFAMTARNGDATI